MKVKIASHKAPGDAPRFWVSESGNAYHLVMDENERYVAYALGGDTLDSRWSNPDVLRVATLWLRPLRNFTMEVSE